jgi:hypothetical protein
MKRPVLLLAVLAALGSGVVYLSLRGGDGDDPRATGSPSASPSGPAPTPAPSRTRFGVMLSTKLFDIEERVALAADLGVKYFRTSAVFVDSWDGSCSECQAVRHAGLKFVLTIRNSSRVTEAASPPDDPQAYGEAVRQILRSYRPALVVIESEENTRKFYLGTADEYGAQLGVACTVAHDLDIPCANGGLLSGSVVFLVYQHYVDAGRADQAGSFAQRAFEPWQMNRLRSAAGAQWIQARAAEVRAFLAEYPGAGADFVNFHWYVADRGALEEAVAYLEETTGLPAITNEVGQRNLDPGTTSSVLAGLRDLGLRYAVWFSIDATLARALIEPDGTLRPTGVAFRSFVLESSP